jgi:hypothetical protein
MLNTRWAPGRRVYQHRIRENDSRRRHVRKPRTRNATPLRLDSATPIPAAASHRLLAIGNRLFAKRDHNLSEELARLVIAEGINGFIEGKHPLNNGL